MDDVTLGIDKQQLHPTRSHLSFIAENLLCYVVIFEQLLPRFCRVDLVSPKISLMLYRITKVCFSQVLLERIKLVNFRLSRCLINQIYQTFYGKLSNALKGASPLQPITILQAGQIIYLQLLQTTSGPLPYHYHQYDHLKVVKSSLMLFHV